MQKITEDELRKLSHSAGEDAVDFTYITENEWNCVCGTHNPLDITDSIQHCSSRQRNRNFVLEHCQKPGETFNLSHLKRN